MSGHLGKVIKVLDRRCFKVMQKKPSISTKRIMSIEEYVKKRKKLQEKEKHIHRINEEKSPAWMMAELFG